MVFVDFSNPFTREYLAAEFGPAHRRALEAVRARLPAWAAAARALEAGGRGRPLAAVVDVDEVVLGNIHANTFQAAAGVQGPGPVDFFACDFFEAPGGGAWPRAETRLGPLLPGARELLEELRRLGVAPVLLTGRLEPLRAETIENLALVGLAGPGAVFSFEELGGEGGALLMCPAVEDPPPGGSVRPFKEGRRARLELTHRIVLNIGDQVSDLGLHGDWQVQVPHPFYRTP